MQRVTTHLKEEEEKEVEDNDNEFIWTEKIDIQDIATSRSVSNWKSRATMHVDVIIEIRNCDFERPSSIGLNLNN